jgi:Domain of unknown function (DUF5666)
MTRLCNMLIAGLARPVRRIATTGLVLLLVTACGGGDPGVGSGGTGVTPGSLSGTQQGTVSGFGSVIAEGNRYDDSSTTVTNELDPAAPAVATVTQLRLGMQIALKFDDNERATEVRVAAQLVGPVESVGVDGLIVAGQRVRLASFDALQPVFDGFDSVFDLAAGDRVAVHGLTDVDDVLVATRIERLSIGTGTRVTGLVEALAADSSTLRIGTLTVTRSAGTTVLPAGTALANGQRVIVYGDAAPVAGRLAARTIAIDTIAAADAGRLRIGGLVRELDRGRATMRIGQVNVDYRTATFVNGTATDLVNSRLIRVTGTWSGAVLRASEVRLIRDSVDNAVEIRGTIADFFSTASFRIRFTRIDASAATVEFRNGNVNQLAEGAIVRITGRVVGGALRATRVEFENTGPGGGSTTTARTLGLAYAIDPVARTLRVNGVLVRWSATTRFDGNLAELRVGVPVRVEGLVSAGELAATRIEIRPFSD